MKWADSPRAVCAAADVILSMVTNSAALSQIAEGPNGMLEGLGPGKVWIDMSTVSPAVSRGAGRARCAKKARTWWTRRFPAASSPLQQGKLSVMVGGRAETFERVKPILLDLGPKVTHVGENGLALVMKIATNLSLAVQMLAFSEGVLLAEKSGIPRETAVDVLTAQRDCVADASVSRPIRAEHARRSMVQREHDAEGHAAGARVGPAGRCAVADQRRRQRISDGCAGMGLAEKDFAVIFKVLEQMSGVSK